MLDHIFMFVEGDGPEIAHLASLGLAETYRRVHPGQGTRNACYGFDNMFLELLWVDDRAAVRSALVERTGLHERSLWRENGSCPFGISWRRSEALSPSSIPSWPYRPPYLPQGMSIAVATDGDDPGQPMMFESPGSTPPLEWPEEKRGSLQHDKGLGSIIAIGLELPSQTAPSRALLQICAATSLRVSTGTSNAYSMTLHVASTRDESNLRIVLPLAQGER